MMFLTFSPYKLLVKFQLLTIGSAPMDYHAVCFPPVFLLPFSFSYTTVLLLFWNMSGTTRVSRYQKGKPGRLKPIFS